VVKVSEEVGRYYYG